MEEDQLTQEQVDLLYDHRRMKAEDEEPVLVTQDSVTAVREVLGRALSDRGVTDPQSMGLEALASQFVSMDSDEAAGALTVLAQTNQMPETGGQPAPDEGAENGGGSTADSEKEKVSAEDRNEARSMLKKASRMESRTPKYSENLRQNAASIMDVDDPDDIDIETL